MTIRFEHDEPAPVRRIDTDGFLLPDPQPTPVEGDKLVLRDDLFVADALIFDRLSEPQASATERRSAPPGSGIRRLPDARCVDQAGR